ncbi:PASTA domain-containing protein [Paenibacillus albiflavus]|uniref:PASTA domain-containing protein n=1 Tax=Paenibacillus albiflavus TaxID=2545760 RepID=A0A4R4EB94_9BACL|nr:PASTA domain-containing protein [Paenibacillus albiflavus]TCZ75411.1 PASTA domain-containing protein [Paenibacillus albiflavus]
MGLRIGDRYQLTYAIQSFADGVLYAGKELSLQRDVIIYIWNNKEEYGSEDLTRVFGQTSQFNNKNFFHVLNAGIIDGQVYVVFTSYSGKPLTQSIQHHTLGSKEILTMVYELASSMYHATEEQLYGYSVFAENIWLTNDNHLKVINYWTSVHEDQTNAIGLCLLMYQLCAKSSMIPKTYEAIEFEILHACKDLSSQQQDKLTTLIRRVFRGDNSLVSFVTSLREIIELKESVNPIGTMVPKDVPSRSEHNSAFKPERRSEQMSPSEQKQPATPKQAANYRSYRNQYLNENDQEEDFLEQDQYDDKPKRGWVNKIKWIAGIIVALLIFVGTVILVLTLLTSSKSDNKQEPVTGIIESTPAPTSTPPASDKESPAATAKPNQKPAATPKPTPVASEKPSTGNETGVVNPGGDNNANTDGEQATIPVPDLSGLTLEEAQNKIKELRLYHEFALENSDAPVGTVFKQQPEAGELVAKGSRMKIWVSRQQ